MEREMAMFPLGTVLVPGGVLPLHVFEPRYRAMVEALLEGDPRFGVCLIERGSEVGGGDVRTDLATVAVIARAQHSADGRWALITVGESRLDVVRWLDDDPWPRAVVTDRPESDDVPPRSAVEAVHRAVVRLAALRSELGEPTGSLDQPLPDDAHAAVWSLLDRAGLGPLDTAGLLAIDDPTERLDRVALAVAEATGVVEQRLGGP